MFREKVYLLVVGMGLFLFPSYLWALPSKAKKLWEKEEYRKAANFLDKYLQNHPRSPDGLLLRGRIALKEKDLVVAHRIFRRVIKYYPHSGEGYYYLSKALGSLRKTKKAFRTLEIARALRPRWHKIYIQRAWLYLGMRKIKEAYQDALFAKRLNPKDSHVFSLLGYVCFRMKKISKCRAAFQKALRLDPYNSIAHWYLGTGLGYSGTNQKIRRHKKDWELLHQGISFLERNHYEEAIRIFSKLLKRYPQNSTCHFLLAEALNRKAFSKQRVESIPEFKMLQTLYFSRNPQKRVLSAFFHGYSKLSAKERAVLAHLIHPVQSHVIRLISIGYIHYLLPLDKRLGELPHMRDFQDRYAHDGRRYGDLRGLTYAKAVSGKETLWNAYAFSYNTVAHELAHQVHMYSFSHKKKKIIQRLYQRALRYNRCLDYYSTTTVYEYFAQGYEAFISRFKRPGLGFTAHHTREELLKKDPQLFWFLRKYTQPDFQPFELALIYFFIGRIYTVLEEKEKAFSAFTMFFLLSTGILQRD